MPYFISLLAEDMVFQNTPGWSGLSGTMILTSTPLRAAVLRVSMTASLGARYGVWM